MSRLENFSLQMIPFHLKIRDTQMFKVRVSDPLHRCCIQAVRIGEAGQEFVGNEIGMHNVYDYMYHMIKAYAGLQRFKPSVPRSAREVTQDFILCLAQPHERLLLEKSRKQIPWTSAPCHLPETPPSGFKDFGWEAPEKAQPQWSETNCRRR